MGIRKISRSITSFAVIGSTVIIGSHLLGLVEELRTDILLLRDGQGLLGGPLDVVLDRFNTVAGTPGGFTGNRVFPYPGCTDRGRLMTGCRPVTLLLWVQFRGNLLQRFSELASVRGALSLTFIVLFVGALVYSTGQVSDGLSQDCGAIIRACCQSSCRGSFCLRGEHSTVRLGPRPYFNRAEVKWLWSAPISRCWLVYYKLCGYAIGTAMTSLLLVVMLPDDLSTHL